MVVFVRLDYVIGGLWYRWFIGGFCKMICVWKYFEIDFVWCGRYVLSLDARRAN